MDQPELAPHVSFHVHEEDHDQLHLTKPPQIALRSLSKSDPHLSIPHLLMSQDEDHPSLNRIVSGLFHVGSALRTPNASSANLKPHFTDSNTSIRSTVTSSESSCGLPQSTPLRKSSSATDWSGVVAEATRKNSKQLGVYDTFNRAVGDSGSSQSGLHLTSVVFDNPNEGTVMSSSADYRQNSSTAIAQTSNESHFSQGVVTSTASSVQSLSTGSVEGNNNSTNQSHGVFGNLFNRGFFSKPVLRSEEESYRYLLALDR
ncbi:hypothetical protein KIN20_011918 [Parelaphostrongylus tenuis]|uniref:Uncharacterized protein n=1 Tax=Parelaphostrongylus tenuis TaxID=148309 RepID=A0AAD5QQ66_PARTN|nr:hypothetical protein KIN20_011918 [Parelaphostrongylus tenuis]